MSAFLAGLGAALTEGSRAAQRAQDTSREARLDKDKRDRELLQMALQQRSADEQTAQFGLQQQDRERAYGKDLLDIGGPEAVYGPEASAAVEKAGFGFRLAPETGGTLTSQQFSPDLLGGTGITQVQSPGQSAGRAVIPTSQQAAQLADVRFKETERETARRAMQGLQDPRFEKMDPTRQAMVWQQAGLQGKVPNVGADRESALFDHKLRMQEIGATGQNALAAASARAEIAALSRGQKPPTGAQNDNLKFYNRMRTSGEIMAKVEAGGTLTDTDIAIINDVPLPGIMTNWKLSPAGQSYMNAMKTWTEARLRDESGAAIPPHEYENDRRTIGRQVGDLPATLLQKQAGRDVMLDGAGFSAGPAYEAFYGEPFQRRGLKPVVVDNPGGLGAKPKTNPLGLVR